MTIEHTRMGDLPDEFMDKVMREFVPYSVALGRVCGDDASSFIPLGSGTFVIRRGKFGILTARHCLHACTPQVHLGTPDGDIVVLILRGGRSIKVSPNDLIEHDLTSPASEEFGPDLTFIEIVPGERLNSCKAIASFWSLDQDYLAIEADFGKVGNVVASVGFPEADYQTRIDGNDIHHKVKHMTYLGLIEERGLIEHDGWDYMDSTFDFRECSELPQSFVGVSGGGIWGMQLRKFEKTGPICIDRSALIGVTFYQSELRNESRRLRSHFIRSIYQYAWQKLE